MFISRCNAWFDSVDPYAIQRVMAYKAYFITLVLVFIYWICRPEIYIVYLSPLIMMGFYETPLLKSYRAKDYFYGVTFTALLIAIIAFYLLHPFKVYFLYFALGYFVFLYRFYDKHLPEMKNIVLAILATAAFPIIVTPSAVLQVANDMIYSGVLVLVVTFLCLRFFPCNYLRICRLAFYRYIQCLAHEMRVFDREQVTQGLAHFSVITSHQQLLSSRDLLNVCKMSLYARNIQVALALKSEHSPFWEKMSVQLEKYSQCILNQETCVMTEIVATIPREHFVLLSLHRSIMNWNRLCSRH